jgi:tRNA (cmo5U34)-methyltransferase
MTAMKFEDQDLPDLDQYAVLAERYIPGRRAIFAVVEASFLELLPGGPAKILVVGAGGGEEILRLDSENPSWSFVGVDTYEPMVDLARRRLAASPVGPRSNVHSIAIEQLGETAFDAATCILTARFVPDDGSKLAFFEAIRARLRAARHCRRRRGCWRSSNGTLAAHLDASRHPKRRCRRGGGEECAEL